MAIKRVIFFGASVTAQRFNTEGAMTGYIPNLEILMHETYGNDIEICSYGLVGSHFDFVVWLFIGNIIEKINSETLFVSEWHTTSMPFFSNQVMNDYYGTLLQRGCIALTLVLPMKSFIKSERKNIRQTRQFQNRGIAQLNLCNNEFDINTVLRDEVHTTETGGKIYAKLIFDVLRKIIDHGILPKDEGPEEPVPEITPPMPPIWRMNFSGTLPAGSCITVKLDVSATKNFQIFAHINRGPHSPTLLVDNGADVAKIETWNRFSYYPHKWSSLLGLTPNLKLDAGQQVIKVRISGIRPNYEKLSEGDKKSLDFMERINEPELKLVLSDKMYFVGLEPDEVLIGGQRFTEFLQPVNT